MRRIVIFPIIAALLLLAGCQALPTNAPKPTDPASQTASVAVSPPLPESSETGTEVSQASGQPEQSPAGGEPEESAEPPVAPFGSALDGMPAVTQAGGTAVDVAPAEFSGGALSSSDDAAFSESTALRADFDGDGRKDVLDVSFDEDYPPSNEMNCPVTVTLTVAGASAEYENTWNDGVSVGIADFDTGDPYLDIYITAYGTDVSATVVIYRYDGSAIREYLRLSLQDTSFLYDAQGHITYIGVYGELFGLLVADCATGDIRETD